MSTQYRFLDTKLFFGLALSCTLHFVTPFIFWPRSEFAHSSPIKYVAIWILAALIQWMFGWVRAYDSPWLFDVPSTRWRDMGIGVGLALFLWFFVGHSYLGWAEALLLLLTGAVVCETWAKLARRRFRKMCFQRLEEAGLRPDELWIVSEWDGFRESLRKKFGPDIGNSVHKLRNTSSAPRGTSEDLRKEVARLQRIYSPEKESSPSGKSLVIETTAEPA